MGEGWGEGEGLVGGVVVVVMVEKEGDTDTTEMWASWCWYLREGVKIHNHCSQNVAALYSQV